MKANMKIKTSELTDAALDWCVAKCEGYQPVYHQSPAANMFRPNEAIVHMCDLSYSTDWSQGGPIIERECICISGDDGAPGTPASWTAIIYDDGEIVEDGPTPLIAAMRCYVASKLGDEVDVPGELIA